MSDLTIKIKSFEFVVEKLLDWYEDYRTNDFSKLKSLKLLFFVTAISTDKENDGLLKIFNNFWAMPYGHVEKDIYENLNLARRIHINNNTAIINSVEDDYYDEVSDYQNEIISSIDKLKTKNENLVYQTAFDLVELSHQWYSWKTSFNLARIHNKLSISIPTSMIKSETKILKIAFNEFY